MTIEDMIRQIVREEIAHKFPQHRDGTAVPTHPPFDWIEPGGTTAACKCILTGRLCATTCGYEQCSIRPPTVMYSGATQQRMGCTCPPGSQTSCPDVTCPWKPR